LFETWPLVPNTEIMERFQSKASRMAMDAPWYVPNAVIRRDVQTPKVKEEMFSQRSRQLTPKRPRSEPHGATRQRAVAESPAKRSACQIPSVNVVFLVPVCKVWFLTLVPQSHKRPWSHQLQRSATEHSSTCHCIRSYTICWMQWYRMQIEWTRKKSIGVHV
jgi:hypothetical protein